MIATYRPSWKQGFARYQSEAYYPGLRKDLVATWIPPLGPSGATLHDVGGRKKDSTLFSMDPATAWVMSSTGWVLAYNGSTNYVTSGVVTTAIDNITLAGRFYPNATGDYYPSFYNGNSSTNGYGVAMHGSKWGMLLGGVAWDVTPGPAVVTGVWQHVAIVRRSGSWYVYKDGIEYDLSNSSSPNTPTLYTRIGWGSANNKFNGRIAETAIWNRALVRNEFRLLAEEPLALVRPRASIPVGTTVGAALAVTEDTFQNTAPFTQDEAIGTAAATGGTPPYTWELLTQTEL